MVEYSLLLALIATLLIVTVTLLGARTAGIFDDADDGFSRSTSGQEGPGAPGGSGTPGVVGPGGTTTTTDCTGEPLPPGCPTTTTAPP